MYSRVDSTYDEINLDYEKILRDHANPLRRIISLIPEGSKVLDIGSGSGTLSKLFKYSKSKVIIDCIEPNEFAISKCTGHYRKLLHGYSSDYLTIISNENYDYIVIADVLEHTVDPYKFLKEIFDSISENTKVIISIPNVAFGGVRIKLLNGNFDYVDSGILEKTHLRFFTLKTSLRLFFSINFHVSRTIYLERSFYRTEFSRKELKLSFFTLLKLAKDDEARAYQYLFELNKGDESREKNITKYGPGFFTIIFDYFFYRSFFKRLFINCKKTIL